MEPFAPLPLAQALFQAALASGTALAALSDDDAGLAAHVARLDATPGALQLPRGEAPGALATLPDGAVVRFRGMVQDMFDPECVPSRGPARRA